MRILRKLYAHQFGPPSRHKPGVPPWRIGANDPDRGLPSGEAIPISITIRDIATTSLEKHAWSFLSEPRYAETMKEYHIVFRFKTGCETPRSVDGKIAWTTRDTTLTPSGQIRVTFKTQEGGARIMDEFVPQASLLLCSPGVGKGEQALVFEGVDSGKIVFPSRIVRNEKKFRTGLFCKLTQNGKKKDEILYTTEQLTRVVLMSRGPPAS